MPRWMDFVFAGAVAAWMSLTTLENTLEVRRIDKSDAAFFEQVAVQSPEEAQKLANSFLQGLMQDARKAIQSYNSRVAATEHEARFAIERFKARRRQAIALGLKPSEDVEEFAAFLASYEF